MLIDYLVIQNEFNKKTHQHKWNQISNNRATPNLSSHNTCNDKIIIVVNSYHNIKNKNDYHIDINNFQDLS